MINTSVSNSDPEPLYMKLNFHNLIISSICIVFTLIFFFLNFAICLMHIRQSFLRQGFFKVIFSKTMLECLTNTIFIIINIIMLIKEEIQIWIFPFIVIFDFSYYSSITYELTTVFYLLCHNGKNEEVQNDEPMDKSLSRDDISLRKPSFKAIHIISILLGFFHAVAFGLFCFYENKDAKDPKKYFYFYYYFYFLPLNADLIWLAFFSINCLYFITSIAYLFLSWNVEQITHHIRLKHFSIYCFISGTLTLIFPVSRLILMINDDLIHKLIMMYVSSFSFLIYLWNNNRFKRNCYYVQRLIGKEGKQCLSKTYVMLKILFCCEKIEQPNFLDLNNSFVFHSLANMEDFIVEPNMDKVDSSSSIEEAF